MRPQTRRRTGHAGPDRRTASRWHRAGDTGGSPGGSERLDPSGREAGSRGPPARRARRAVPPWARTEGSCDPLWGRAFGLGCRRRHRRLERVVHGRAAHREDDVLDGRGLRQLLADRPDGDECGIVEGIAADPRAERREGDARRADLARPGHRAADGRVDDRPTRASVSIERYRVDHGSRGQVAGRCHDRPTERHRRLADRGELDRVAASALDGAADTRGHPQGQVRRVHNDVDLELADVAVPEFDPSHRSSVAMSVRIPTGPAAASYTRGSRRDIEVTTSQEFVVRICANSAAEIRSPPCSPRRTNSSLTSTGGPGTSLASTMTASIATLPTIGTRRPRTRATARL